ncbi:hypothetical protein BDV23DRAFT_155953 [Aspergillus alliaceus]|uniref:Uncharacterized protein n=1 Tax=Petromyces alliaceus TaxID=209559 RepID=A0A5N7C7N5_PETAA|nr:hypothetical protein BDV23DRAFT_155953 [Aspergillus alliaceus]
MRYLQQTSGKHLVKSSLLGTKALMRRHLVREQDEQAPLEMFGGLDRFCQGIPQAKMGEALIDNSRYLRIYPDLSLHQLCFHRLRCLSTKFDQSEQISI